MFYKNNSTGTFGHTLAEVRRAHPNMSIPEGTSKVGVYEGYVPSPRPMPNWNENVIEATPVNGVQKWSIIPCSEEQAEQRFEMAASDIRSLRDRLLAESDWTQLDDVPMVEDKFQEWKDYRQALRDITLHPEFPWNQTWPTKPE